VNLDSLSRSVPPPVKKLLRANRTIDILLRRSFATVMRMKGRDRIIESGPLAGLKLVVSPHISYAYLSGEYEAKTTEQIDRLVQSGFVCYDLGASIGYIGGWGGSLARPPCPKELITAR
jgi:hypothetical protein